MDILDIFGHFYLNHLSPLWGYFYWLGVDMSDGGVIPEMCTYFVWDVNKMRLVMYVPLYEINESKPHLSVHKDFCSGSDMRNIQK